MACATVPQWMAARALCEGAPATPERVAAAMGVDVGVLLDRSVSEDWRCVERSTWPAGMAPGEIAATTLGDGHPGCFRQAPAGPRPTGDEALTDGCAGDERHGGTCRPGQPPDGPAAGAPADPDAAADPHDLPPGGTDPAAVLAGASAFVAAQMAALIERAERSGSGLDKKEIDGLSAFAAMLERWEARALDRVQEEETTSDDDLARYVRDVNERIVALAALEARRLLAAGFRPQDDA